MNRSELITAIRQRRSCLCVGLDTDPDKVPAHLRDAEDPVFEFNRQIIDATRDRCVAYKPNTAFYEATGASGWETLRKTAEYIGDTHLRIADAKRGDIGNTSERYAKAFFNQMDYDAITVAPYMGSDSVSPFLGFPGKWVIVLAHTSNPGSADFQLFRSGERALYEEVISKTRQWAGPDQLMFVVGATRADRIQEIRAIAPENFFLVPGIGAQGGSLEEVMALGMNKDCGLLINASRSIIYASSGTDFADAAEAEATRMQQVMDHYLTAAGL